MSKPLHDSLITNLPTSSIQWVKIYLLQILWIYQWLSTKLLTYWSYCSLAPNHQCILHLRPFSSYHWKYFLVYIPPYHIQNSYQTYNGNSMVFWQVLVNANILISSKNLFECVSEGSPMQFDLVQTMALNQQRNKPLTHWLLGNRNVIVKMHFSILIRWLVSSDFHKSTMVSVVAWSGQATSYYLIKPWSGSMSRYGVVH